MRPRERRDSGQNDLFKARLDQIVDTDHALAKLGRAIDWRFLEKRFGAVYSDKTGHPPLPTRLMAGLSILEPMHDLSDEDLCARWVENPYYQLFCGEEFFQHKLTFNRSPLQSALTVRLAEVALRFKSLLANPRRVRGSFPKSATAAGASGSTLRQDGSAVGGRRPLRKSPHIGVPRTEDGRPRAPWVASNAAMRFSMRTRSCTRNSRSRCGRFASSSSTVGTTTILQASGSPANFAARTRRRPKASSRSVLARRALRVTNMLVGSTTWLITPCAERSRCNQNPSRPASKHADDKRGRAIRRIQPVAQAGDESKQPCAVACFQTMKLSLVVRGQTIRDDPAQFDSEIDDLLANIRRHASAPGFRCGAFPVWQRPRLHSI